MADQNSRPLDPRMAGRLSQKVHQWRECPACNYDLRGAPAQGQCPECGLPIEMTIGKIDDALSLMPMPVIKRFRFGALLSILGLASIMVAAVLLIEWRYPSLAGLLLLLGGVLWITGAWFLTPQLILPQGAWRGFTGASRVRRLGRWLQLAWFPLALLLIGAFVATTVSPAPPWLSQVELYWWILLFVMLGIGMLGLCFEVILLCELADWVRDGLAKQCLGLGITGLIITSLSMWYVPLTLISLFLWIVSACAFGIGFVSLGVSISHSVRHAKEYQGRIQRQRERTDDFYGGMLDRNRQADSASEQLESEE